MSRNTLFLIHLFLGLVVVMLFKIMPLLMIAITCIVCGCISIVQLDKIMPTYLAIAICIVGEVIAIGLISFYGPYY